MRMRDTWLSDYLVSFAVGVLIAIAAVLMGSALVVVMFLAAADTGYQDQRPSERFMSGYIQMHEARP